MNNYIKIGIWIFLALVIVLGGIMSYKSHKNPLDMTPYAEEVQPSERDIVDIVLDIPKTIKQVVTDFVMEIVNSKIPKAKCTTYDERHYDPECKWANEALEQRDAP